MSGTGSNPAWVDGYIPPASEWNAWFGFKLDAASPLMDGAPFVSLAGTADTGPITGVLAVSDDVDITGNLSVNGVIYINPTGLTQWSFSEQVQTGDHIQVHSTGHWDQWVVTNGIRYWFSNNTQVMTLDTAGNLTITGVATTHALQLLGGWTLSNSNGTGDDIYQHVSGSYDLWQRSTGDRYWYANLGLIMTLDVDGNLVVPGQLQGSSLNAGNGWLFFHTDSDNDHTQQHSPGNFDIWVTSTGGRQWYGAGSDIMNLSVDGTLNVLTAVHAPNILTMTSTVDAMAETIDELRALVQDLQTRLETLEAAPRASHT